MTKTTSLNNTKTMSAKIISFATQKGGVGKSTLLMLTAASIHNRTDKSVLVIDSDPQKSIKEIFKQERKERKIDKKPYDVIWFEWHQPRAEINFQKAIALAEKKYDIILIDVPGKMRGNEIYYSILTSDILIVPVVGSLLDANATYSFLESLPGIRAEKEEMGFPLEVYCVINKRDRTREYDLIEKIKQVPNIKFFYSPISNLVRYKRYISTYKDITDPSLKDDEFNKYFDEFITKCMS